MRSQVRRFLNDASGATAIEYALIAGLIFLVIVGSITALRGALEGTYTKIGSAVGSAAN